jgi:mRNA interferase RelE/StbE
MNYTVFLDSAAKRQLRKLPDTVSEKLYEAIHALAEEPRPSGCVKLEGTRNLYRVRVGAYRIVYTIDDKIRIVKVVEAGNRRDMYK